MISFENLKLSGELLDILRQFKIDFVFQPIYSRQGIVAYEALMRPEGMSIGELICRFREKGKLHDLELASFFGAAAAFRERGCQGRLHINSFPSECLTKEEVKEFTDNFGDFNGRLVIEILELSQPEKAVWDAKQKYVNERGGLDVSLDDFGSGYSDMQAVDYYNPKVVKLDRLLISGIDHDKAKQAAVRGYIRNFRDRGISCILAEGVENEKEYRCLRAMGLDMFQGYYLGIPC